MGIHTSNIPNTTSASQSKAQRKENEPEVQQKDFANDTAMASMQSAGGLSGMHAFIQAKLNIGTPGDKFEKEADATADAVMSKPFVQKAALPSAEEKVQPKTNTINRKEEEVQEKSEGEEQINMTSFWSEFHAANPPVVPPPPQDTPSPLKERSLFSAGKEEAKPNAKGGAAKEEKVQKKEEDTPVASKEEETPAVSMKEDDALSKKSFLQMMSEEQKVSPASKDEAISKKSFLQTMSEEQAQTKARDDENQIARKSFVQTELFDDKKDVRNDMLNAKEEEGSDLSMKEDESPELSKKEEEAPGISMKEEESSEVSAKEEESSGISMKEDESSVSMKDDESSLAMKEDETSVSGKEDEISPKENEEIAAKEEIQTKGEGKESGASFENQLQSSKGSGNPMSPDLQTEMSSRFGGKDFSGVKIHTDGNAVDMNKQINAKAFTNKSDIYFNSGQFDGSSNQGKTLLAHELTHTIQQGAVPSGENVQRSVLDEFKHPEDGENPKKRLYEDAEEESGEDIDFDKKASEEEKEEARGEVDHEEKKEQTGKIAGKGIAKPDVDRPKEELPKVKKAASDTKKKLDEKPAEEGDKKKEPTPPRVDLAPVEAKEASALAAYEKADKLKLPKEPKVFKEPRFETPVDKKGEPIPGDTGTDKAVRTLHEIAKLLAENAYTLQNEAVNDERESWNMRAILDESFSKVASTKAGSTLAKADKAARLEINSAVEGSYEKNVKNVELVKAEAPKMKTKAAEGKDKAGPMVDEAKEKKKEMKEEETEESGQDEKDQQEETNKVADGSMEMDSALENAEKGSDKYLEEAIKGEEKNNQARSTLDENIATDQNTQTEIDRIDTENAVAEGQLTELDAYPEEVQQQTVKRAETGAELYAAAEIINDQLIDIQNEYYDTMKAEVPGAEEAAKKMAEMEQQAQQEAEAAEPTEEQQMLLDMAGMETDELDAYLLTLEEDQLQTLQGTLADMTTQEEEEEAEKDRAGRQKFDLETALFGKNEEEGPQDPRAMWYGEIENRRGARVGEAKKLADANFTHLSKEQKQMLSQKMAMGDAVTGLFDINIMDMGVSMIKGMIDPRESLKGVLNGANQMIGGVVNLFNAEAWKKDPLGNLLQSAADIATGLTTIFMSITGLALAINILMGALTIASLGTMSWLTGPVMAFMSTVMSTVGGWTVITGLIALELNALTYIKNLHDAGNAENTDELIFESDSMKQNMTDGFTSLTAVVGGKGSVKGANMMKGNIFKGGFGKIMNKFPKVNKFIKSGLDKFLKFAQKTGRAIKKITVASIKKVKNGLKKAIDKIKMILGINKKLRKNIRTWNEFQSATKGQFKSRAEAAKAWELYKKANNIIVGTTRSSGAKSNFLKNLAASGKAPKWMNQWLRNGKVPPGYHVDHIKPLSIGGADAPGNMRLLDIAMHRTHHKFYRPWE